jgi:hypothetical protein
MATVRLRLIRRIKLLEETEEVSELTKAYITERLMPDDPAGDALHLALASCHKIDVLLTWNCKHLANPNKIEDIRRFNEQMGLPMPLLATPLNYLTDEERDV